MLKRDPLALRVARIVADTDSEGPGRRFAIWVQGCPLHCPGCCNPEMLPFEGGELVAVDELARQIARAAATDGVEGITLLGGEPMAQAAAVGALCATVAAEGLGIVLFTGYTIEALRQRAKRSSEVARILDRVDLIIDGPYDAGQPEQQAKRPRRWIGSRNQRVHNLSGRYDGKDPCFYTYNTVEIRWDGRAVQVNGWPAAADAVCCNFGEDNQESRQR